MPVKRRYRIWKDATDGHWCVAAMHDDRKRRRPFIRAVALDRACYLLARRERQNAQRKYLRRVETHGC